LKIKKSFCVGLTGSIASGKTTLANFFLQKNVPVFFADLAAKKFYQNPHFLTHLESITNHHFTLPNKTLNTHLFSSLFFSNSQFRAIIEKEIHPKVKQEYLHWLETLPKNTIYHVREAAILIETNNHLECDSVLLMCAPEEIRIQRALSRNPMPESELKKRIALQWPEDKKRPLANICLENPTLENLPEIVEWLHSFYTHKFSTL
jgi:dephospho-CoA kinase